MKITTQIIKDLKPCKDRLDNFLEHYPEFEGDHEDFLSLENITHNDKLWVTLRLMDRIDVEVFAIDCAVRAASAASAADAAATYYATSAASASATSATSAASTASATSAADATYYATSAAYYAATSAADAAASAYYAYYVSASNTEQERQLAAVCYLINKGELNEN